MIQLAQPYHYDIIQKIFTMASQTPLQTAFVLHLRPYRETSCLLDFLTLNNGRISAIAKGVRGSRKTKKPLAGLLMPFVPLLVSFSGKGELYFLQQAEAKDIAYNLPKNKLLCGLYLNELLTKILHIHDPHPDLFYAYEQTLTNLQNSNTNFAEQYALRIFEKQLLKILGYELQLDKDIFGSCVLEDADYFFSFGHGLKKIIDPKEKITINQNKIFSGRSLLALEYGKIALQQEYSDAKRLLRIALQTILENRLIKTRELFLYTT